MIHLKRLIYILCALIVSMSVLTVSLSASSCGLACGMAPGVDEEFSVAVALIENAGIRNITLVVNFPSDRISLVRCTDAKIFDTFFQYIDPQNPNNLILNFATAAETDNFSVGNIATLTFVADDTSDGMALLTVACESAYNSQEDPVAFSGMSTAVIFADEEIEEVDDESEILDDEEIVEDDEEILDEEDEEVTTATTKKTEATTKKTEAATTTKKTEATTTEKTTAEETTTEATTTSEATTETTTTSTGTLPITATSATEPTVTTATQSEALENDMLTGNDYSKRASKSTVVLAVSLLLTVIVFAVGIEVYKRFFMPNEDNGQQ